jgi:hypothetical protein
VFGFFGAMIASFVFWFAAAILSPHPIQVRFGPVKDAGPVSGLYGPGSYLGWQLTAAATGLQYLLSDDKLVKPDPGGFAATRSCTRCGGWCIMNFFCTIVMLGLSFETADAVPVVLEDAFPRSHATFSDMDQFAALIAWGVGSAYVLLPARLRRSIVESTPVTQIRALSVNRTLSHEGSSV